jgi:Tfp pilus assembly protein PilO
MSLENLSKSERRLVFITGTLFAIVLNLFFVRFFLKNRAQIQSLTDQKTEQYEALRALAENSRLWEARATWLQTVHVKLDSEAAAGNSLINFVKVLAARTGVSIAKQQLSASRVDGAVTAVPVQFELKGNWKAVCGFLMDLQAPDRFLVLQQARLKIDPTDATSMQADLTVAKWFPSK